MYKPVDPKVNFPKMEENLVSTWKDEKTFETSISQRDGAKEFVFFDGPPFATGLPHFGHFVPGTIKDIIPRYKTMRGFKVERRFGWDCHGLPVENLIEKELGLDSKTDIERYGVANFNEACRASVLRYTQEWRNIMTRAGRWVDFDHDYKTMDPDYMESIWWVMKSLWDKGLIYEGSYILPYCPRCSTVLSNHEIAMPGVYKDVHDPAITIKFKVKAAKAGLEDLADGATFLLAWTTTPWTLPSNLALCMGPDIDYVCVQDIATDGHVERYILAEPRLSAYYKDLSKVEILWKKKGEELKGLEYEPLFPYFAGHAEKGAFRTITGSHVTTEDGTGIVHTAPGFGEEDYQVLKGSGVPVVCPIDAECKFTSEVPDYQGRFVKDCDKDIMERLKAEGKLVKREQVLHSYPHCWRCEHPLIYRGIGSWFVKIDPVKQKMLDANSKIYWQPAHIKAGRFGKWLENARDWAISRSRYWGNPLPIWRCDSCKHEVCVGSRDELEKLSGQRPTDLHKHFVDKITWKCSCGGTMTRIPEVLDCWFESGSMPYAQVHYPYANKASFESKFPADFIAEGLDQTRGWFYSLTVLAAALFDSPAFQACVVNGLVLAEDGKKMSKSLRNYTDPSLVMDKFGADALRLFLMNSAVTRGEDLCYSDEGVREVLKGFILPLWNAYGFFVTYANIDGYPDRLAGLDVAAGKATNQLDRWILSSAEAMVEKVTAALEAYDMQAAIAPIVEFSDLLNNWYIRRSRRRFWRSVSSGAESAQADSAMSAALAADKASGYATLEYVMKRLALCLAPIAPFVSDEIWRNLRRPGDATSVHLADWPVYNAALRDLELERKMDWARRAVSMGRSLRVAHDLKIRQPLRSVHLVTKDKAERAVLEEMADLLKEELNVKEVIFREDEEELVEYSAKANFRVLGKELGKDMKLAADAIEKLAAKAIAGIVSGGSHFIEVAGRKVELTAEKVDVRRSEKAGLKVQNEGSLTIALDAEIDRGLLEEGWIRDLVRGVQSLRKEAGFEVTDRIRLDVGGDAELKAALERFMDFVSGETLAREVVWEATPAKADLGGVIKGSEAAKPAYVDIEAGDKTWKAAVGKA